MPRVVTLFVAGGVMMCGLLFFTIPVVVANIIPEPVAGWARFATLVEKLFDRGFIVPTVVSLLMICSPPVFVFLFAFRNRVRGR